MPAKPTAVMGEQVTPTSPPAAAATSTRPHEVRRLFAWSNCRTNGTRVNDNPKLEKAIWIYSLDAVAAVLVLSAALVTGLKVRGRDKESEGKESEDASEHGDE